MSVLGIGGSVRSRRSARVAVYGEPGGRPGPSSSNGASSNGGKLGPAAGAGAGPICGPMIAAEFSSGFCGVALGSSINGSARLLDKSTLIGINSTRDLLSFSLVSPVVS